MVNLYGIANCDTVKKTRKWLDEQGIEYSFHDYKKSGVDGGVLTKAVEKFGWEKVLNKRGTTWRKLSEEEQQRVVDDASAIKLMSEQSSMIKRPIVEHKGELLLGFNADNYSKAFDK